MSKDHYILNYKFHEGKFFICFKSESHKRKLKIFADVKLSTITVNNLISIHFECQFHNYIIKFIKSNKIIFFLSNLKIKHDADNSK